MAKGPLFQPQQLGSLTLPNRVVMTTVKLGNGTQSSEVNDHHIAFYTRRAQGEAALLTTEPFFIQDNGRESEIQITPTKDPRCVMVVGGEQAGLEAANIAALRGHHVSLYEQKKRFGEQLLLAVSALHKEEFLDVIRYVSLIVEHAGVEIHLGQRVTPEWAIA